MKLARTLSLVGLAGSLGALLILEGGCSSSSSSETTESGSSSSSNSAKSSSSGQSANSGSATKSSSSTVAGTGTPPVATGTPTTSTTKHNFAVHHLYVGDSDPTPAFKADSMAWANLGYNIDGQDTKATCPTCCKGGPMAHQNGNNGIDNAFGEVVVSTLQTFAQNLSSTVSAKIASGSFTIELDTLGLTGAVGQTNTALTGELFAGGNYGSTPPLSGNYFSITDNWPVSSALLNNPTSIDAGSMVAFPAAYINNGTWVSGTPVNLNVSISFDGFALQLTIHHAVLTFVYAQNGTQGLATTGIISGVLEANELLAAINQVLGDYMGGSLCSEASVVSTLIGDAEDLYIDPSTGDVSNTSADTCNGISIGLGFDADEIAPPSEIAPPVDAGASLPPCGASGSGSGSGSTSASGSGSSTTSTSGSSSGG